MDQGTLKNIVEAALLAAGRPLSLDDLQGLFEDADRPDRADLREALGALAAEYEGRGISLVEVASGWRGMFCFTRLLPVDVSAPT